MDSTHEAAYRNAPMRPIANSAGGISLSRLPSACPGRRSAELQLGAPTPVRIIPGRAATIFPDMNRLISILILSATALAEPISDRLAADIADAIWHAEGRHLARVPYGVLSVRVQDAQHAREITLASIRANWRRWEAAGRPGTFPAFMARRWVPASHDPRGHHAWVRNVERHLRAANVRAAVR